MFVELPSGHVRMDAEAALFLARILVHVSIITIPLLLAYLFASVRFDGKAINIFGQEPQKVTKAPWRLHRLPIIGDTLGLLCDTEGFLRQLQAGLHVGVVPLSLPGKCLNIAMPGDGVRAMFRNSRDYVPVPGLFDALTVFFGLSSKDFAIFDHDFITEFENRHDGDGVKTTHPDPSRRIMEHQRRDFSTFLNGESLRRIMSRFSRNFEREIRSRTTPTDQSAAEHSDLYTFVRNSIFKAEVEALYGEQIFVVCPSFCDDFWAFYDAFPVISRNIPRFLFPLAYRKRDKMLSNFQRWRTHCHAMFDWDDQELVDCDYEPTWGTRYVRRMLRRHERLGFSEAGISSAMLGYLFVTTANTIPAAAWMVLHAFLDPSLTRRLRHETRAGAVQLDTDTPLDLIALGSAPLLNSVYRETLRLHVASATGRTASNVGFGSHQNGAVTMTANWLGGLDATFWNEGRTLDGSPEHPVDGFWAERFLEYPDDIMSGPIRKTTLSGVARQGPADTTQKTVGDDARARIVNAGLRGHWFPFGGGAYRCPGETLAKNTILASVFLLLRDIEIELLCPETVSQVISGKRHRALPFGTHAFSKSVPIKVRRRTEGQGGVVL